MYSAERTILAMCHCIFGKSFCGTVPVALNAREASTVSRTYSCTSRKNTSCKLDTTAQDGETGPEEKSRTSVDSEPGHG